METIHYPIHDMYKMRAGNSVLLMLVGVQLVVSHMRELNSISASVNKTLSVFF